ncbi:MAG: NAD(P)/FAD-dependent oxidoreductase [Bdellovibrionaceae bacterium]|nr:NAD(P)/FAD-dependent oxidoreductase [Bdellovibrio sp.]
MHIYDYIIIGSGLTGLTIAKKIHQETENILVLEAQDYAGGSNRAVTLNGLTINNGLRFYPATELSEKSMSFLETQVGQEVVADPIENHPETYEAHGFKPFVGFGENPPAFYDQLSYFLTQKELPLTTEPHEWMQILQSDLQDKIQTKSIVTKFVFENLESGAPALTHVLVNGSKTIYARNFIYAAPLKDLGLLLPDDILNQRAKAKLKKSKAWQAVCLDLFHTAHVEKENMFILNGTTDDDIGPCVGRFFAAPEGQISQWISFIESEVAEDTEAIGHVLKKMKRQIKRAFPDVSDSIKKERIFVTPILSGSDMKLTASNTVPKVPNLWVASSQASPSANLLGSLQQAQLVLAALGFGSGIENDTTIPVYEEDVDADL